MKEDAAAKELEDLLREALSSSQENADLARGATPLVQLKTVPLQVQPLPEAVAAPAAEAPAPESIPGLADRLAPESVRPPKASPSKRSSVGALIAIGLLALGAAGGAVWYSREHRAPLALLNPPSPVATEGSGEGAVGLSVSARPAPAAPVAEGDEASGAVALGSTATAATTEAAPAPSPIAAAKDEAKIEAKPADRDAKGDARAKSTTKTPSAERSERSEKSEKSEKAAPTDKSEKVASTDKSEKAAPTDKSEKSAAATPAPAAQQGSVDALLQQQLKGAIP